MVLHEFRAQGRMSSRTHRVFNLSFLHHQGFEIEIVAENIRVGFGSEDFNDLPLIRENSPTKSGANIEARQSPLVRG